MKPYFRENFPLKYKVYFMQTYTAAERPVWNESETFEIHRKYAKTKKYI